MGIVIGNYKGLSHPVPIPNEGVSLHSTQTGKKMNQNKGTDPRYTQMGKTWPYEGASLHITEIGSEPNYGHNKREISYGTNIRPKAEKKKPHKGVIPPITFIRPKAEQDKKKAYTIGENLSEREGYDPSDPNLGNAAQTCGNCVVDPFTGKRVAQNIRMDEGRIMMMRSSPDNQSRPEEDEDESTGLSPMIQIPIKAEAISQLITQQLRTKPGLEAVSRQGHEINRCWGSFRGVSPVPEDEQKHAFFTIPN
jgi:hypothetical protein